jgi:adenosylmethionine-8-amino-7-oxononanoate aminotransferase
LEIVADKAKKARFEGFNAPDLLRAIALQHGLLLYSRRTNGGRFGDWVMVSPPLTVTEAELDEIVERLDRAVADFGHQALGSFSVPA